MAVRRRTVAISRGRPCVSPQAARTAGAICTTVILSGSRSASRTSRVSSRSRSAPTGQWVMHWPHSEQSESLMRRLYVTSTVVREPEPLMPQTPSVWIFSQYCTQRIHLMHFCTLRYSGNVSVQMRLGRSFLYGFLSRPKLLATCCNLQFPARTQIEHSPSC